MHQALYLRRLRLRLTIYITVLAGAVLMLICTAAFFIACGQYRQSQLSRLHQTMQQAWTELCQDVVSHPRLSRIEQQNQVYLLCWVNGSSIQSAAEWGSPAMRNRMQAAVVEKAAGQGIDLHQNLWFSQQQTQCSVELDEDVYDCLIWVGTAGTGSRGLALLADKSPQTAYLWKLGICFALLAVGGIAAIAAVGWLVAGRSIDPAAQAAQRQSEFVAAAGHELRTPLAVLRASTTAMANRPDKADHYTASIDAQCERLGALVNDLLLLAGSDAARLALELRLTEPDTLMLDTMEQAEPLALRRKVRLSCELPPHPIAPILADDARLRQILLVLLDNALRYAPPGSTVTLGISCQPRWLSMWVRDCGPGVPDDEKEAVFGRFYRSDRQRTGQHFGLGLAVASELAALHGGDLSVQDTPGGGATFVLRLPAK